MIARRSYRYLLAAAYSLLALPGTEAQKPRRLLIAFSSFRDRPLHPRIYFYEHDGVSSGRPAGEMEASNLRVDTHPSLARGGALCACASEVENQASKVRLWNPATRQDVPDPPGLNAEGVSIGPALSAEGNWVVFAAWQRPGGPAGWNLFLYDLTQQKQVAVPVNSDEDEQSPTISGDGRFLAFVSSRSGGAGRSDLYLFDRTQGKLLPLPGLNTRYRELDPALSADGRYLAFTSDRPGGAGARDIYLYDRRESTLVPLPGLNGAGIEQTPALSPDGRYLAFVAERVSGEGERDVYLYDRAVGKLLPTPLLNSKAEDFDPSLTYRTP